MSSKDSAVEYLAMREVKVYLNRLWRAGYSLGIK
jgi:hypothetical protein